MRSRKGKIRLDITKLEQKELKDLRRIDVLKRQVAMTRNILEMLRKSMESKVTEEAWKPSEIKGSTTLDSGSMSDIPAPEVTPLEGK